MEEVKPPHTAPVSTLSHKRWLFLFNFSLIRKCCSSNFASHRWYHVIACSRSRCYINYCIGNDYLCFSRGIPVNGNVEVALESDGCRGSPYNHVVYLEHVQAVVTLSASRRGEVEIYLTSPQGTRSTLLARRLRDTATEGFNNWAFMTTHNWGESATGTWRLEVRNGASMCKGTSSSHWHGWC